MTLHFAEVYFQAAGMRSFDVVLGGDPVLENYDPYAMGFATADVHPFDREIQDGILNLEFRPLRDHPKISAIEIERLD